MKNIQLIFIICLFKLTFYSCTENKIEVSKQKSYIKKEVNIEDDSSHFNQTLSNQTDTNNLSDEPEFEMHKFEKKDKILIWHSKDSLLKLVYYKYTNKCASLPYVFYYKGKKLLTLNENNFFKQVGDQVEPYCLPYINYPPERIANGVYAIIGESRGSEGYFFRNIWILKCTKNKGEIKSALVISQPGSPYAMHLKEDTLQNKVIAQVRMKKGFKYTDRVLERFEHYNEDYIEEYYSCRINGKEVTGRIIPKKDSFNYYYDYKEDFRDWRISEVWELDLYY